MNYDMDQHGHLKRHVNASGFPLQIAIINLLDSTKSNHGWQSIYTEHAWSNPDTRESGFIDLVIENQHRTQVLVVECKRVKDTSWIFLVDQTREIERRHAKSFVFRQSQGSLNRFEWLDLTLSPASPESEFCVIPGTDSKSKSLIERTGAELVSSTEGLALEEKRLSLADRFSLRIYLNVIVTTATLNLCQFDPKDISIESGSLDKGIFTEVPFVRFRKQLSPTYEVPKVYQTFSNHEVALAKESTIFVVNSKHLLEFISAISFDSNGQNANYLAG